MIVVASLLPATAAAHSFVEPYLLPVPFWLYVYACAATLVATFAIFGYFLGRESAHDTASISSIASLPTAATGTRFLLASLRGGALACLLLTVVAGFVGSGDPLRNIAMPLFWMVFLLGFAYVVALIGDLFELANPWRTIVDFIARVVPTFDRPRLAYPHWLGYYPALALYMSLIWLELFVLPRPATLSTALTIYTLITLAGVSAFGSRQWFHHGEMFSVFFRIVSWAAPIEYVAAKDFIRVRLRPPLRGAIDARPEHASLVLFILFMLSSTAYDAIHDTEFWLELYWQHLVHIAQPLWGTDMVQSQNVLMRGYFIYQRLGLLLSPLAYFGLYVLMLAWAKRLTRSPIPVRKLALDFAPSLVPIAIVYNVTHYYTLLLMQVSKLGRVATDPFGLGWNLFGLGMPEPASLLDMGFVWHSQVALVLIGHVSSVYLAHVAAMRVFANRRQAIVSQLPLLVLMVAYTAIGLYILSLPIGSPQIVGD